MSSFENELVLEILDEISDHLISLEDIVGDIMHSEFNNTYYSELLRIVHSIKGNAQAASFSNISALLHKFEDYIIELNAESEMASTEFLDILIKLKETLDESVSCLKNGDELSHNFEEIHELFDHYQKINLKVEPSEKISNSLNAPQVLLIDDNIEFLEVFKEQLLMSYEDWAISTEHDGVNALDVIDSKKYDLIVTDFYMPKMNGDEFIRQLRKGDSLNKNTPIIMVTGFKPDFDSDVATWEGVFFLEKPITWKKLEFFIHCSFKTVRNAS